MIYVLTYGTSLAIYTLAVSQFTGTKHRRAQMADFPVMLG